MAKSEVKNDIINVDECYKLSKKFMKNNEFDRSADELSKAIEFLQKNATKNNTNSNDIKFAKFYLEYGRSLLELTKINNDQFGLNNDDMKGNNNNDINDEQLSWESLETAKIILNKYLDTNKNDREKWLMLGETHTLLAEFLMETNDFDKAINEYKISVDIRIKNNDKKREIAYAYFMMCNCYSFNKDIINAKECINNAITSIKENIVDIFGKVNKKNIDIKAGNFNDIIDEYLNENKDNKDNDDVKEINELNEVLNDLMDKYDTLEDESKEMDNNDDDGNEFNIQDLIQNAMKNILPTNQKNNNNNNIGVTTFGFGDNNDDGNDEEIHTITNVKSKKQMNNNNDVNNDTNNDINNNNNNNNDIKSGTSNGDRKRKFNELNDDINGNSNNNDEPPTKKIKR